MNLALADEPDRAPRQGIEGFAKVRIIVCNDE